MYGLIKIQLQADPPVCVITVHEALYVFADITLLDILTNVATL